MKNKCTQTAQTSQHLIAGLLPTDNGIEFYGLPQTKEVQWIQNGHSHSFSDLPPKLFVKLANAYNSNIEAKEVLEPMASSFKRKVELYTYFMYGGLDNQPDMVNGELQEYENFRDCEDCISLNFKSIRLNGNPLKRREVHMLDIIFQDNDPLDSITAEKMNIATSTFGQHKRELFEKTGTHSKSSLILLAIKEQATRVFS